MKKNKLESLSLNKKVISNLNAKEVKGGDGDSIITFTLLVCTRWDGCDMPTIGHDDGSYCISKDQDAWCGGRVIDPGINP